jgi:flagella basal body P-ring formation protein FlgA
MKKEYMRNYLNIKRWQETHLKAEVVLKLNEFVDKVSKKYLYADEYLPQEMHRFIAKYLHDKRFPKKGTV